MKDLTYIGKSYPVQDAAAKATGELLYVDDMTMPRMLYAKALFSPVAHARIKRIDTTAAEALPGVWAVATYQNTPQTRFNSTTRFYMQAPAPIETERIFDDTVRFVGDRVAAVAAETEDIAQAAIDLIAAGGDGSAGGHAGGRLSPARQQQHRAADREKLGRRDEGFSGGGPGV